MGEGKSGVVETGLTGPVATALYMYITTVLQYGNEVYCRANPTFCRGKTKLGDILYILPILLMILDQIVHVQTFTVTQHTNNSIHTHLVINCWALHNAVSNLITGDIIT